MEIMTKRIPKELRDSLWILWTLTVFFNSVAFFYIGSKVKYRGWILSGAVYLIVSAILFVITVYYWNGYMPPLIHDIRDTALFIWLLSILHAFFVRGFYLKILYDPENADSTKANMAREFRDSSWILWTFTIVLSFIAFLYIGSKVKHRLWILSGLGYLIATVIVSLDLINFYSVHEGILPLVDSVVTLMSLILLLSIAHAFFIRKDYLDRLNNIRYSNVTYTPVSLRTREESGGTVSELESILGGSDAVKERATTIPTDESIFPIDINTCTEDELTSLPGISVVRAKKAAAMRSERGGFDSLDDFLGSLNIEPHFAAQIRKLVTVSEPVRNRSPRQGRKIEL